jgi:glucokinase
MIETAPPPAAAPWLVADIGGTNARFGWVDTPGAPVRHVRTLPTAGHAGPAEAAQAYLQALRAELGGAWPAPRAAAIAVATSVTGDLISYTNGPWRFSRAALPAALGVRTVRVLNDFEALALALPGLRPGQFRAHAQPPQPRGVLAVVGPGTGLGVGAAVQTPVGWQALPGEGGHATLAPTDDEESRLLGQVRQWHAHVSGERLLSGIGLPVLHRAVCALAGAPDPGLSTPQVIERGLTGGDALARRTLGHFCALLGGFCGSVVLTLGARGGLYIGGGIVPRLGDFFFDSAFRARFEAKGRFSAYLAQVPTAVIIDTEVALQGAAAALAGGDG